MLTAWKVRAKGVVYGHGPDGVTPQALADLLQQYADQEYTASSGRTLQPPYTPDESIDLAADLLFGAWDEVLVWEDDGQEPDLDAPEGAVF